MEIRIGIICEGDRDYDLLCALIEELYPKHEFIFRLLQPDGFLNRELGNGWKGVWSWCRENGDRISEIALGIQPGYDLFIVQMDSDVSRNEKEAHCACHAVDCQFREKTNLPKCNYTSTCAIRMPCPNHEQSVAARTDHLCSILSPYFPDEIAVPIIFTFPSDSTDAWIVAALDELDEYEEISDPWNHVIAAKPLYHGVKCQRKKKSKKSYEALIALMLENIERIFERCTQAAVFREELTGCIAKITATRQSDAQE